MCIQIYNLEWKFRNSGTSGSVVGTWFLVAHSGNQILKKWDIFKNILRKKFFLRKLETWQYMVCRKLVISKIKKF